MRATKRFEREEHRIVAESLGLMDPNVLAARRCWFGGGTAIVLMLGEYRISRDVDFLCSDEQGYRELRSAAVEGGIRAFFSEPAEEIRAVRTDQYGIRAAIGLGGHTIRFEIVREARIDLDGELEPRLGVPVLSTTDLFAEKLLANADRCQDRSASYRDALDLGMLARAHGGLPKTAVDKAIAAYGRDIEAKVDWVLRRLGDQAELRHAAETLQMEPDLARQAVAALDAAATKAWSRRV